MEPTIQSDFTINSYTTEEVLWITIKIMLMSLLCIVILLFVAFFVVNDIHRYQPIAIQIIFVIILVKIVEMTAVLLIKILTVMKLILVS